MIGGAAQADAALLVLNASQGEFEAGLGAQTREHLLLARSLGVARLLVAINQMDSVHWKQARHEPLTRALVPQAPCPWRAAASCRPRAPCPLHAPVAWAQARYKQIVAAIGPIVRQSGFPPPVCVPVSALDGLNLGPDCPPPEDVGAWVTGRSLVSRCEAARTPDERVIG